MEAQPDRRRTRVLRKLLEDQTDQTGQTGITGKI